MPLAWLCSLLLYINIIILSCNFISLFSFPSAFESFVIHSHGDKEFFKLFFSLPRICILGDLVAGHERYPYLAPYLALCSLEKIASMDLSEPGWYIVFRGTTVDLGSFLMHHASNEE